jgi:K+-transporting ATPase ATPase C chain
MATTLETLPTAPPGAPAVAAPKPAPIGGPAAQLLPAALAVLAFTLLTGLVYPLLVTGIAALAFPHQAGGSLVEQGGRVVGSELVGQPFGGPGWFWSRPSATAPAYNAGASSGSNLGPSNPALHERVAASVATLRAAHGEAAIPVDLATASGSGLDPHLSPAAAFYQVERVARERGLGEEAVRALVERHVEGRTFGLLGEPRVNVLRLNLALAELAGPGAPGLSQRSGGAAPQP